MADEHPEIPLALVLPLGVVAAVHALALALGSGSAAGASFGTWGRVNVTAALLVIVVFAVILRRHRSGDARPDPGMLAWALAAADLAAMVVAAMVLRPWG
jgi:hypothetical protein